MGSPFTIVLFTGDSTRAAILAEQSFKLVDSFNLIFSDYIDSSEISRLGAAATANAGPVSVSPAFWDILKRSAVAFDKSGGSFDITIGPLVKLWRRARKANQFPTKEMVYAARELVGFNQLILDTSKNAVALNKPGMQLDLGGIAKGWIAQKVIDFLKMAQVSEALANAGGDIALSGAPPGTAGWTIGVNVPETTDELLSKQLLLQNKAVATSGDAYQFMENKGKRYSHIIDPRSGYGITTRRNVTVIAGDGATADWLATACSILPVKKAKKLAAQMGAELQVGEYKKGKIILYATRGFANYWKPR